MSVHGGGSGDIIVPGYDNLIVGTYRKDALTGTAARDRIEGGAGNDTINGGGGNDVLEGGSGADRFVFGNGSGDDVVLDFDPGSLFSRDVIDLRSRDMGAIDTFVELTARMTSVSGHTVIELGGGDSVTLLGIDPGDLAASHFML